MISIVVLRIFLSYPTELIDLFQILSVTEMEIKIIINLLLFFDGLNLDYEAHEHYILSSLTLFHDYIKPALVL